MATATTPTQDRASEQVAGVLALLDAAKNLGGYKTITLFAEHYEDGIAEHALRLWASANGLPLEDLTNEYPEHGYSIRSIEAKCHPTNLMEGHVRVQWRSVPLAPPAVAPVATETTEPAPSNVVPLPPAPAPAPVDAVVERAQPRDLDDAAARFSLLELD